MNDLSYEVRKPYWGSHYLFGDTGSAYVQRCRFSVGCRGRVYQIRDGCWSGDGLAELLAWSEVANLLPNSRMQLL